MCESTIQVVFEPPPKSRLDIIFIAFPFRLAPSPRPGDFLCSKLHLLLPFTCLSLRHFDNTSSRHFDRVALSFGKSETAHVLEYI
jgi:hypothetical protein